MTRHFPKKKGKSFSTHKVVKFAKGGMVPRVNGKTVGDYYFNSDTAEPKNVIEHVRQRQDYDEADRGARFMEGPDGKNRAPGVEKAKDEEWSREMRARSNRK